MVEIPHVTVSGVAVAPVGNGNPDKVTVTDALVELMQKTAFQVIITCPSPKPELKLFT